MSAYGKMDSHRTTETEPLETSENLTQRSDVLFADNLVN